MSYSYERHRRQTYGASTRRTAWGYWIPLAVTVTVATAGLVAWVWSERKDDEEDDLRPGPPPPGHGNGPTPDTGYGPPPQGYNDPPLDFQDPPGFYGPPGQHPYAPGPDGRGQEDESIVARMSGALRRTPSPQQILDGASRRVVAGVTAAGAVVGGALSSIREEDKTGYEDHSRWSEEAGSHTGTATGQVGPEMRDLESSSSATIRQAADSGAKAGTKRKTVAIVVSAETDYEHSEDANYHQEHASILSHLPEHVDAESRSFVLIYVPDLKQHPLAGSPSGQTPLSIASSYSNIGHEDAQSQGEKSPEPELPPTRSKMFDTLYAQAQALVEKDTMIIPFTTPTGYVHLLRHLGPEAVYLQQTISGERGDGIDQIKGWVGQIILVVGDESGHGGLVDSEDERGEETKEKWWQDDPRIGLGKGIEVVESLRVGEDWKRRISRHD
ncbi:hypothetical protein N7G274_008338 [Stereocaulon virgatum]|uniref:Uncharacterized protein n=1 Tax=Stereocaulon virgatum TaxID=373712 RepID=A0ABR4A035_9LECA